MAHFNRFRRFIFLLLSLTLSVQAMAVASMGACHRMKSLTALHDVAMAAAHNHPDSALPHDAAMHHSESSANVPSDDDNRSSCAACAACHLSSVILNADVTVTDIPVSGAVTFPDIEVPRESFLANGLERPPRA